MALVEAAFEEVTLDDREDGERRGPPASTPQIVEEGGGAGVGPSGASSSAAKAAANGAGAAEAQQGTEQAAESGAADTPIVGGSIVGDVLYSIATGEEEGKSRARILAFAAKRYQNAVEKNPKDYDALYNWALVLQESADNCGPEVGLQGKDALLEEACHKYQAATDLCATLHEAFYNWAIAISDRAKIRGRTAEAEDLWRQACDKYERAVHLNWDSPQALNNWGLALQELGNIVPAKEKRAVIRKAINKFRAAIRLRYDFHRAIYNLGTVLYGLAEDTAKAEKKSQAAAGSPGARSTLSLTAAPAEPQLHQEFYAQSAVYIACAHSLKADYPVYRNALRLVRTMLPLPFLKAGYLTVAPKGNTFAPHAEWRRKWFILDQEELKEAKKPEPRSNLNSILARTQRTSSTGSTAGAGTASAGGSGVSAAASISFPKPSQGSSPAAAQAAPVLPSEAPDPPVAFPIASIVSVDTCADLSLPRGGGIVLGLPAGPTYLVADDWDTMDSWVDAIRLVYTIYVRGRSDELSAVLAG